MDFDLWAWLSTHIIAFIAGAVTVATALVKAIISVTQVATRVDAALVSLADLERGQAKTHREVSRILGKLGMSPEADSSE